MSDIADPLTVDISLPGFIDRWRAMSAVQAQVIATSISDMKVDVVSRGTQPPSRAKHHGGNGGSGGSAGAYDHASASPDSTLSLLRIALTSRGDLDDDAHTASALVHVGRSRFINASPMQEYTP